MSKFLQLCRDIVRESGKPREAFRITEPSGKTYRIFADGHVEGFERGAVICNYIPALLASAKAKLTGQH